MVFQESETVELKSVIVEDIKKEIIAFANCKGGKLYIGVQDDGTVIGLDNPDQTALQISNMVRDAIKPDLTMFLHYETLEEQGKKIVAIDIGQGTERPYYIAKKGLRPEGVYVRQGYSSVPATTTAIRNMIKETDGEHFEEMRSIEQNLTFEAANKEFGEYKIPFKKSQMKTLGIINHDNIYTNLGLLLSDQCVHTIKVAVFEGTTQSEFKDRREFSGSLFKQLHEVHDYIDLYNKTRSTFLGLRRIDNYDYPKAAIREALLNLIVHREYSFSASSFVSIYSDRIEFISIGGLINGVTLSDVMLGISLCRNNKLANIFYRLKLIEAYGTGIRKIIESYKDLVPKIEVTDNAFKIILPNQNFLPAQGKLQNIVSENITIYNENPEKLIMALAKKQGYFSRKEVELELNMSQSTCGRLLRQMLADNTIVQIGKGKNTHYMLSD